MTTDLRAYRRDGYAVIRGAMPLAAIDACLAEIGLIFRQCAAALGVPHPSCGDDPGAITQVMGAVLAADMQAYLGAAKLAQHLVPLHRMGVSEPVVEAMRSIGVKVPVISTRPVVFFMADALKIPGGYHKTPPHQDWRSIQGSLDCAVCWIPFSNSGPGDYALEVLPGSHRRGLLAADEDVFGHKVSDSELDDNAFVPLTVAKGDMVVFSALTVHRTGEKGGPNARIAASFRFNNACEPSFVGRNYHNPYIYKPDVAAIKPGFPSAADMETVFA